MPGQTDTKRLRLSLTKPGVNKLCRRPMMQVERLCTMIQSSQDERAVLEEIVRAVIQGKLPISALEDAGVTFEIQQDQPDGDRRIKLHLKTPLCVEPRPIDIAQGLLVYKDRPEKLREWASFVLSASEIIDLTPLEPWPEGDELLSALWDASFEGRIKDASMRVAARPCALRSVPAESEMQRAAPAGTRFTRTIIYSKKGGPPSPP